MMKSKKGSEESIHIIRSIVEGIIIVVLCAFFFSIFVGWLTPPASAALDTAITLQNSIRSADVWPDEIEVSLDENNWIAVNNNEHAIYLFDKSIKSATESESTKNVALGTKTYSLPTPERKIFNLDRSEQVCCKNVNDAIFYCDTFCPDPLIIGRDKRSKKTFCISTDFWSGINHIVIYPKAHIKGCVFEL